MENNKPVTENHYVRTFGLMLSAVKFNNVYQLEDFTRTQKRHILTTFLEEADDETRDAALYDTAYSVRLSLMLIKLSELSKENLELTEDEINAVHWGNIKSILDNILDSAQIKDFKQNGGISDDEDARRLDLSIRCREAANDDHRGVA